MVPFSLQSSGGLLLSPVLGVSGVVPVVFRFQRSVFSIS